MTERFTWHPRYRGKTVREVTNEIQTDLARDQRAVALTMEGAEQQEHAVLAAVIELDKKWSTFDLDWATADAAALASTVAAFELERDRQQELFPYRTVIVETDSVVSSPARPWWRFWQR